MMVKGQSTQRTTSFNESTVSDTSYDGLLNGKRNVPNSSGSVAVTKTTLASKNKMEGKPKTSCLEKRFHVMEKQCELLLTKIRELVKEQDTKVQTLKADIRTHVELGMARNGGSTLTGIVLAMKKVQRFQAEQENTVAALKLLDTAEIDIQSRLNRARAVSMLSLPTHLISNIDSSKNLFEIPTTYRDIESQVNCIVAIEISERVYVDDNQLVEECTRLFEQFSQDCIGPISPTGERALLEQP